MKRKSKTYSTRKESHRWFTKRGAKLWVKERNENYRKMGSKNRAEYRYLISEHHYGVFIRRPRR